MGTTLAAASAFVDLSLNDGRFREGLKNIHAALKPTLIATNQLGESLKSLGGLMPSLMAGGLASAAGIAALTIPAGAANPAVVERLSFALQDLSAVIGQGLVPYVEMTTEAVRGLADWLYNLDPSMKAVIAGGAVLAVGLTILGTVIVGMTAVVSTAIATISSAVAALAGITAIAAAPILVVVAAIAAAIASVYGLIYGLKQLSSYLSGTGDWAPDAKKKAAETKKPSSSFGLGYHQPPAYMDVDNLRKSLQIEAFRYATPEKADPAAAQLEETKRGNQLLEQIRDKKGSAITA